MHHTASYCPASIRTPQLTPEGGGRVVIGAMFWPFGRRRSCPIVGQRNQRKKGAPLRHSSLSGPPFVGGWLGALVNTVGQNLDFQALFESMPGVFLVLDPELRV